MEVVNATLSGGRRSNIKAEVFIHGVSIPSKNVAVLSSLIASSVLGLAMGGSQVGGPAIAAFVDLLAIASVVLWPICARRSEWGYRAVIVIGTFTLLLASLGLVLEPTGASSLSRLGAAIWGIIQVPVIYFAYGAYKETISAHNP